MAASLTGPRILLSHQIVMGENEFTEDTRRGPHSRCRVTPKAERAGLPTYTHTHIHVREVTSPLWHTGDCIDIHTGPDGVCVPPTNTQRMLLLLSFFYFPNP